MILRKQIFCVMTMACSASAAWGMYKNNRMVSIEAALASGGLGSSTPQSGGRPPLSPYSPRILRTPNSAPSSRRGSINGSPLGSDLVRRLEAFSLNAAKNLSERITPISDDNGSSPISQFTPISASPITDFTFKTVIEEKEPNVLSAVTREIRSAHLYIGIDHIDSSVDSLMRDPFGTITWIVLLDEKKYGIASCEINYQSDSKNNNSVASDDALIIQYFEDQLLTFVDNKMTGLGYTKNK